MNTSYRPIQLLPEGLQNQIAAGEVVERPSSVVKELIENSLDAGSTSIHITVEDGGQSLIAIRDNGKGIPAADIPLALTRHATSKITSFQELSNIASYGFRGEALPSIASVSILRIESAFTETEAPLPLSPEMPGQDDDVLARNQPTGHSVESHYGTITKEGPCALHQGTHIVIRDLFANVPARLKFLKTPATELRRCQDTVTRLALAQPQCSFTFSSGTREIFTMPAGMGLKDRLAQIWPASIIENLLPVNMTHHNIQVQGLVSAPHSTQGKSDRLLLYVNNRPVTDKLMISAVRQAYKGKLTSREYPQGAVFVSIDPHEVDVNVHPAKTEVRFRDERALFSAIIRSIDETFARNSIFLTSQTDQETPTPPQPTSRPLGFWGSVDSPPIIPSQQGMPSDSPSGSFGRHAAQGTTETIVYEFPAGDTKDLSPTFQGDYFTTSPASSHAPSMVQEPYVTGYGQSGHGQSGDGQSCDGAAASEASPMNLSNSLATGLSGPVSGGLTAELSGKPQEASLCDNASFYTMSGTTGSPASPGTEWHYGEGAPSARNTLPSTAGFPASTGSHPEFTPHGPAAHGLISGYPIQVGELTCLGQVATTYLILVHKEELLLMDQHAAHEQVLLTNIASSHNAGSCQLLALPEQLSLHGDELEQYEQYASKLTQMGYQTELMDTTLMVSGLPPLLPRGQALQFLKDILEDKTEGFDDIFHMMACRAAIKAGDILTADEAAALLQQWLVTPNNLHCPHGRPIIIRFGKKELEKLFKRTVG